MATSEDSRAPSRRPGASGAPPPPLALLARSPAESATPEESWRGLRSVIPSPPATRWAPACRASCWCCRRCSSCWSCSSCGLWWCCRYCWRCFRTNALVPPSRRSARCRCRCCCCCTSRLAEEAERAVQCCPKAAAEAGRKRDAWLAGRLPSVELPPARLSGRLAAPSRLRGRLSCRLSCRLSGRDGGRESWREEAPPPPPMCPYAASPPAPSTE